MATAKERCALDPILDATANLDIFEPLKVDALLRKETDCTLARGAVAVGTHFLLAECLAAMHGTCDAVIPLIVNVILKT